MIHCGLPNESQRLRLSADFRYQRRGDPTVWQAGCRLFECHQYLDEARDCLQKMDLEQAVADRAWELMRRYGPSPEMDIPTQARQMVNRVA